MFQKSVKGRKSVVSDSCICLSTKLTIHHPRVVVSAFGILPEAGLQFFCHSFLDTVNLLKKPKQEKNKQKNSNVSSLLVTAQER